MGGKAGTIGTAASTTGTKARARAKPKARTKTMTPAAVKANRANGRRGGRPRKADYAEIFAELEPCPEGDPLAACVWVQKILGIIMRETCQGRGNSQINADLRALAGVILRAVPTERLGEVEKLLEKATKARRKPAVKRGPETEDVAEGPPGSSGGSFIRR
jgi:hypothetical protein